MKCGGLSLRFAVWVMLNANAVLIPESRVLQLLGEEHLVVVELRGVIDNEFLYSCESSNCRLLMSFD